MGRNENKESFDVEMLRREAWNAVKSAKAKKEPDSAKFLMYFSSVIFALTWAVVVYEGLVCGEWNFELLRYIGLPWGIGFGAYCCKCGYENKTKIECEVKTKNIEEGNTRGF